MFGGFFVFITKMYVKRKRVLVSIRQKLDVLDRLEKDESIKRICGELRAGMSTVNDWHRNRKAIPGC